MQIAVCVKAIPVDVYDVRVAEGADRVLYKSLHLGINEADEYALEEAVALKQRFRAEITVFSMGSRNVQDILYRCLAKRADKAVRVDYEGIDSGISSLILAEALRSREYDLILTGVESQDVMASQVGVSLSVHLGLPFAYAVTEIDIRQDEGVVRITKELGGGMTQVLDITLPAVLCCQTGICRLTYPPLAALLKAKRSSIEHLSVDALGIGQDIFDKRVWQLLNASRTQELRAQAEFIVGSPKEASRIILSKIKEML